MGYRHRSKHRLRLELFFGAGSLFDVSVRLHSRFGEADGARPGTPATNQKAELWACILALAKGKAIAQRDQGWFTFFVVIKADSKYLVKGMTEWIIRWSGTIIGLKYNVLLTESS